MNNNLNIINRYIINNMNNNLKIIGLIILTCIIFITILYFFRNNINKHGLIENFFNVVSSKVNTNVSYPSIQKSSIGMGKDNDKYNGDIKLRNCQVYFVGEDEKQACDALYKQDPLNTTCKYEFNDGWKEIERITYSDKQFSDITEKIYNKDYNNKSSIDNHFYMTACFKNIDTSDNKFRYSNNSLINHKNIGTVNDETDFNNTLRLNANGKLGNYISQVFNNSTDNNNNHDNLLNSICSIEFDNIQHLNVNKKFYKFKLKKSGNNWILDNITNVILTPNQNNFTLLEESSFDGASSYGMYFGYIDNIGVHFTVFKNSTIDDIPVDVYRFKYNYLCDGRILEYKKNIKDKILMNNLISSERTNYKEISKHKFSLDYDRSIIPSDFWNDVEFKNESQPLKDIITKVKTKIDKIHITILNDLDKNPHYSDDADVAQIDKYNKSINESKNNKNTFHDTVSITDKEENITKKQIIGLEKDSTRDILFNYDRGFRLETIGQEDPRTITRFSKIDEFTVSATSLDNIRFGAPGLNVFYKDGYYWDNFRYFDDAIRLPEVVTDFAGIVAMSGNKQYFNNKSQYFNDNQQENYSFKWSGKLYARKSGLYRFHTHSDDASHLFINGQMVVNNGGLHGGQWVEGDIDLVKGQIYDIEVYFGEYTGGDTIHIDWGELNNYGNTQTRTVNQRNIGTSEPWIYSSITEAGNDVNYTNNKWRYEKEEYFLEIIKDINATPISQNTVKIDGINIILHSTDNSEWIPIISHTNYKKYNFFYGKNSNGGTIYLKAVQTRELTNEIIKHSTYISNMNYFINDNKYYNISTNNVRQNTSWNKNITAYKLERIIITGFVFLQKGTYLFRLGLGLLPQSSVIYEECIFMINKIHNNNNIKNTDEITILNGGFYMFSYSCVILLNKPSLITFNFNASLKHNNKTTNVNLYNYLYNGNRVYKIYIDNYVNSLFKELLFVGNTTDTMENIKSYLSNEHDYWDINKYTNLLETHNEKKKEVNDKKKKRIREIDTEITRIKDLFNNIDFNGLRDINNKWFDKPVQKIKKDINPVNIFANFNAVDYITYEKKANINERTPTIIDGNVGSKITTNFQDINNSERSIYVLRE